MTAELRRPYLFFFLMIRRPPRSTLFPYTTPLPIFARFVPTTYGECCSARSVMRPAPLREDRKSTRLNSSHVAISYAVFCLKKKNKTRTKTISTKKQTDTHQH